MKNNETLNRRCLQFLGAKLIESEDSVYWIIYKINGRMYSGDYLEFCTSFLAMGIILQNKNYRAITKVREIGLSLHSGVWHLTICPEGTGDGYQADNRSLPKLIALSCDYFLKEGL